MESIRNENESETSVTTDIVIAAAECILAEENNNDFEKDEALFKAPLGKRKRARKSPRKISDKVVMDKQAD